MQKTARKIRDLSGFTGQAALYELSEFIEIGGTDEVFNHIVVSATIVPYSGPETYIFPANADGTVADWGELNGSFRGGLDHEQALKNAGYAIEHDLPSGDALALPEGSTETI